MYIHLGAFLRHRENCLAAYYHSDTFFTKKKKIKYSHCLGYETICSLYKYYILNFELCLKVEFVILIISLIKVGSNKLGPEIASFIFSQHFKDTSVEHKNFKRSSLT
jgi:hypothetical protein